MIFAVSLLGTAAFALLLAPVIKRVPWLFYLGAVGMAVAFSLIESAELPRAAVSAFTIPMSRCYFAFSLFAIVMYVGVLAEKSRVRRRLGPIRGELSIVAAVLACAHILRYASSYFARLFDAAMPVKENMYVALAVAAVLAILLLALTVTSFRLVKGRMSAAAWKNVQKLAYPFFALVCLHAVIALIPSALGGASSSMAAVVGYGVVLTAYAILRARRMLIDAKRVRGSVERSRSTASLA